MSVHEVTELTRDAQPVEKIPAAVFDAGVGADFDEVHVSGLSTPDGVFATDGCALFHLDWCDQQIRDRIDFQGVRDVDLDWWWSSVRTRQSNVVNGFPQVTVRPFYELVVTAAGGSLHYRSHTDEAVVVIDEDRKVRAIIGGRVSPYSPRSLSEHYRQVVHLIEVYRRQVPTMHPHHAAMAALVAVDERTGPSMVQHEPRVEVAR